MAKVYVETSFFSACVSTRTSEKIAGWRASSNEWWQKQASYHELFISGEVIEELSAPDFPHSQKALKMLSGLNLLELTPEVEQFADLMVNEKVMPAPSVAGDAVHVAVATVYRMDYILTWNVRHLANPNKRTHFGVICMRLGLVPPQIVTPDMLQEIDDEPN
jgi:hypothetical protein